MQTRPGSTSDQLKLIVTNNPTSTSRDPAFRHRNRAPREWRQSPTSFDPQPADSRASRILYDTYHAAPTPRPSSHSERPHDSPHNATSDVRTATPTSTSPSPGTKNPYLCSNCGGDHRAQECDNPKCFICQTVFPNPAARQAPHYLSIHKRDTKRARFGQDPPRGHSTPPTSPFLSRSVQDMNNPSRQRVRLHIPQARLREAAQHHRRIATYHQLLSSLPRTTPTNRQAQPTPWFDPLYENHIDSSRHVPPVTPSRAYTPTSDRNAHRTHHQNQPPATVKTNTASSSMPSLIEDSSDEDDPDNRDPAISDDTRNAVNRRYAQMQNQIPVVPPCQLTCDIRATTYDSDSTRTPIYPDESDEENFSLYWPERTTSSPYLLSTSPNGPSASNSGINSARTSQLMRIHRRGMPRPNTTLHNAQSPTGTSSTTRTLAQTLCKTTTAYSDVPKVISSGPNTSLVYPPSPDATISTCRQRPPTLQRTSVSPTPTPNV